jgi:hypothetical protein
MDTGDFHAAEQLADLLADRGEPDLLRARADASDSWAARRLAELLTHRGDMEQLGVWADTGNSNAAMSLADPGDVGQLRPGPTPATPGRPGGSPSCSRTEATWDSSVFGPTLATLMRPCRSLTCSGIGARWISSAPGRRGRLLRR